MNCAFASDNTSGICPEVWEALRQVNQGYVKSYGDDPHTARAADLFRDFFECSCDVYFVFNGTAANSLALAAMCQSYHSVLVHETAHVETDECGGPEFFSNGTKLLLLPGTNGKVDPASIERAVTRRTDLHFPPPRVLSLTQPTELGTSYTKQEMEALHRQASRFGLKIHVDGARFPHALAELRVKPREITWEAGVSVIACGGTKLGGNGEAVVFFDPAISSEFAYRCKQAGQLSSKMRFLAAPWIPFLGSDIWLKYGRHGNFLAKMLEKEVRGIRGAEILYPVQANSVFLRLPEQVHTAMRGRGWHYYVFIGGGARFMCSWATTEEDVAALLSDLREAAA